MQAVTNQDSQEKVKKITQPDRVKRILDRVVASRLEVLIRVPGKKSVAVRGVLRNMVHYNNEVVLVISDISEKGLRFLWSAQKIIVELVGMSTQVTFPSHIVGFEGSHVLIRTPQYLTSHDRRSNARYETTVQLPAYFTLSSWHGQLDDIISPPVVFGFEELSGRIHIADISQGGFCAITRFPSVLRSIERGTIDRKAKIYFPLQSPMLASIEVRWVRRVRELGEDSAGRAVNRKIYKFGIMIHQPSSTLTTAMKHYIAALTTSEAI